MIIRIFRGGSPKRPMNRYALACDNFFEEHLPRSINIARLRNPQQADGKAMAKSARTYLGHHVPNDTISEARWAMRLVEAAQDSGN